MKNCPLCGHEYYDEAKRCPDCEYGFPDGPAAPAPDEESIAAALEKTAAGEEVADEAGRIAARLQALYEEAEDDLNQLWRRSVEHLRSAQEYGMAVKLWERWKRARPRNER